jgi:hypothetical protein
MLYVIHWWNPDNDEEWGMRDFRYRIDATAFAWRQMERGFIVRLTREQGSMLYPDGETGHETKPIKERKSQLPISFPEITQGD